MKSRFECLLGLGRLLPASPNLYFPKSLSLLKSYIFMPTTYSTICLTQKESAEQDGGDQPEDVVQVLKTLGCSDADINKIFTKVSSLKKANTGQLQLKLKFSTRLGITLPELVKIVNSRPRFLAARINRSFDEQFDFLGTLFGSREMLVKAILRNPSLLTYDPHKTVKPTIKMYVGVGLSMPDLVQMLQSWPTLISRSSLGEDKMEFIRKTGVSNKSRMYKYVVTLIAVSRLETICQKVASFEKFGLSEDEVLELFGRSPYVLTLSTDKVERNMTFILAQMMLPAEMVLSHPGLLYSNLEIVLKPRLLLAGKLQEIGLELQCKGPTLVTAMRMKERRFLKVFVYSQPKEVTNELMEYYSNVKGVKRLAETSKKNMLHGFPF